MAQFREHQFSQASPAASYPGSGGAELGNPGGTPGSRLLAFSPTVGPMSASKINHTPDHIEGTENKGIPMFSPAHASGGGYRPAPGHAPDTDPFGSNTAVPKNLAQQLAAIANNAGKDGYRSFYEGVPSNEPDVAIKAQPREALDARDRIDDFDPAHFAIRRDFVSNILSIDVGMTRCVELNIPQNATMAEFDAYLAKLISLGSPCLGPKQLFPMNNKIYARFTNIRDSTLIHRNIQMCGVGWSAKFLKPQDFLQIVNPAEAPVSNHEGQLDLLAVLLHNAPIDVSQVEPLLFKVLKAEGDLFGFVKDPRSDDGTVKATLEYADINLAANIAHKLNGVMVDGLHIRLGVYQPDIMPQPGRATPRNEAMATPLPTPGRFAAPQDHTATNWRAPQSAPFTRPTPPPGSDSMVPVRAQPTPPTSGAGAPPHVALVPMMVRNPYTPNAQILYDPFSPHGQAMAAMGGAPFMYPQGGAMPPILGAQGYDSTSRPMSLVNRFGGRRGLHGDRGSQYGNNHNQVDVNRIREGVDVRTTIMLRNIPNKVDQRMLKAIVDESSWGKYDFMYLRIDFANDCNVGYAFINFADPLDVIDFANARDNQRWNCFRSDKVAEISYATIQGRDCLVQKFRNSSVMLEAPHYRPKLYYTISCSNPDLAGREEDFPAPDNPSKMKRSCENAEHVGLFTPHLNGFLRDDPRRRRSTFDRGTRMAALEEFEYDTTLQRIYMPPQPPKN